MSTITSHEAEILRRAVDPQRARWTRETAEAILALALPKRDASRVSALARKACTGSLSQAEAPELEDYKHIGRFLELMQAGAPFVKERRSCVSRISAETALLVRRRAVARCEYCHFPEAHAALPFQIDHINARQHCGGSVSANLALACLFCNSAKGRNIAGVDPVSGAIVPLFHPRRDQWTRRFAWQGARLGGKTPRARATIQVL